jgi:pyridoxal phosphate enzyme (YggS family)
LKRIRERIARACERSGRAEALVSLLAVSKLKPAALIREAYAAGQRDFGENYAQELRDKARELQALSELRWHAIGPLQMNKVKYVSKSAHAFHALDKLDVARELSRRREGANLQCYIEINVGDEASKSGVAPSALGQFLEAVRALPKLEVVGLMCLPPLGESPEAARPHFQKLRALAQSFELKQLSMGTTADFEVAIEEGATCVRVGTALFGER